MTARSRTQGRTFVFHYCVWHIEGNGSKGSTNLYTVSVVVTFATVLIIQITSAFSQNLLIQTKRHFENIQFSPNLLNYVLQNRCS